MFRRALIGIGALEPRDAPTGLARLLCRPSAHLTLVRVYGPGSVPTGAFPGVSRDAAPDGQTAAGAHRVTRRNALTDTISLHAASVCAGLGRLATSRRADLVVLGAVEGVTQRSVELAAWMDEALSRAAFGIAIAPAGYDAEAGPVRSVGVTYDGSPESQRALILARRLASDHNAGLRVLQAPTIAGQGSRSTHRRIAQDLSDFSAGLDVLVVGPRGAGPLARLTDPNATLALIREAQSPVVLVTERTPTPPGDDPGDEQWTTPVSRAVRQRAGRAPRVPEPARLRVPQNA